MKILDRIGLALFSSLMLIISIIVCLMIFGWLSVDLVHQFVVMAINDSVSSNIMLGLSIAFILLAIKCIFFGSCLIDNSCISLEGFFIYFIDVDLFLIAFLCIWKL